MTDEQMEELYKRLLTECNVTTPTAYDMRRLLDILIMIYRLKPEEWQ
jgi:hypothetical protein